jgi:hypothetical protein
MFMLSALAVLASACATEAPAPEPAAPPAGASAGWPPEGRSASGLAFGNWRGGDPGRLAPAFAQEIRTRMNGKALGAIRADLEANRFECRDANRPDGRPVPDLECRLGVMERDCNHEWWVVVERAGAEPLAGYDLMCLGALPAPASKRGG